MAHVTFIHGIANKPPAEELHEIWLQSLASNDGLDLGAEGITSEMVYWADVLYAEPDSALEGQESSDELADAAIDAAIETEWRKPQNAEEEAWLDRFAETLNFDAAAPEGSDSYEPPVETMESSFERIPLPWFIKRRFMKIFLRDVHHYLFNATSEPRPGETYEVQTEIRDRFLATLEIGARDPETHLVVSHSMGTVIAYDCLKHLDCPRVDALMTIGSPLGLDEIQDKLQGWTRDTGYPSENLSGHWANVFDRLDPVAGFDPILANDYRQAGDEVVRDINEQNYGKWRHNISKYLGEPKLRAELVRLLGIESA